MKNFLLNASVAWVGTVLVGVAAVSFMGFWGLVPEVLIGGVFSFLVFTKLRILA